MLSRTPICDLTVLLYADSTIWPVNAFKGIYRPNGGMW